MNPAPAVEKKKLQAVLARHPRADASALVNLMHDLQAEFGYLPREALEAAARHLAVPAVQTFRVATFYEGFHLKPRGEHICTVCVGTACHVRGAARVVEQIERDFDLRPGGTTQDLQLTLETVNCVGACALGPLVNLDGEYHGNMNSTKLDKILKPLKQKSRE